MRGHLENIYRLGLIVVVAASLSLRLMVQGVLQEPIAGSMPPFALLAMPVFIVMNLLSGSNTPFDSMPMPVQRIMMFSPSTHFVSLAQVILFRDAGFAVVWKEFLATAAIGAVFFTAALLRFRRTVSELQS